MSENHSQGFSLRWDQLLGEWVVVELSAPHRDCLAVYDQPQLMQVIDLGVAQLDQFPQVEAIVKKMVDSQS